MNGHSVQTQKTARVTHSVLEAVNCHKSLLCLLSGPRPVGYLHTVNSLEAVCFITAPAPWKENGTAVCLKPSPSLL